MKLVTIDKIKFFSRRLFINILDLYQHTLSPDHGWGRFFLRQAGCRFYPSCSEYTKQAVEYYGLRKGFLLGLKRLRRCHPFSVGGYDPIK